MATVANTKNSFEMAEMLPLINTVWTNEGALLPLILLIIQLIAPWDEMVELVPTMAPVVDN